MSEHKHVIVLELHGKDWNSVANALRDIAHAMSQEEAHGGFNIEGHGWWGAVDGASFKWKAEVQK